MQPSAWVSQAEALALIGGKRRNPSLKETKMAPVNFVVMFWMKQPLRHYKIEEVEEWL